MGKRRACLFLTLEGALYAAQLGWSAGHSAKKTILLLFFLCDLCVGANNLPVPAWLSEFVRVAMWGFYLPGQTLILSSTDRWKGENR